MDIQEAGDMYVKGLAVWNENPAAREGLVISALKDVFKSTGDFACLILPSEKSSNNVKRFFRKLGFKTPRDFGNKISRQVHSPLSDFQRTLHLADNGSSHIFLSEIERNRLFAALHCDRVDAADALFKVEHGIVVEHVFSVGEHLRGGIFLRQNE